MFRSRRRPPSLPDPLAQKAQLAVLLFTHSEEEFNAGLHRVGIDVLRSVVAEAPRDHPSLGLWQSNLGTALQALAEHDANGPALLHESMMHFQAARDAPWTNDIERARLLSNHANTAASLFKAEQDPAILEAAVDLGMHSVKLIPRGHALRFPVLMNLARALNMSYRTIDPDVDRSTESMRRRLEILRLVLGTWIDALGEISDDHREWPRLVTKIRGAWFDLYDETNDPLCLRAGLDSARELVKITPPDDPEWPAQVSNLCMALQRQYLQSGDADALTESITAGRASVRATPPEHFGWAAVLTNLAGSLTMLYGDNHDLGALIEAATIRRAVVDVASDADPLRAQYLKLLGSTLRQLGERTGDQAVLREAIDSGRASLRIARRDVPQVSDHLAELGLSLQSLYEQSHESSLLKEAAQHLVEAVEATEDVHWPDRPRLLTNLCGTCHAIYRLTGKREALIQAIEVGRASVVEVQAYPSAMPIQVVCGLNLCIALVESYRVEADPEILTEGETILLRAADSAVASTAARATCLRVLAELMLLSGQPAKAMSAVETLTALMPQLAPRESNRDDRAYSLTGLGAFSNLAAQAALAEHNPGRAVEFLEVTRGILLSETMDVRSEAGQLRMVAPAMAAEFDDLRAAIDDLDHMAIPTVPPLAGNLRSGQHSAAALHLDPERQLLVRRRQTEEQWSDLLNRIRAMPEFATFLLPTPINQLRRQAQPGAIVYLTTRAALLVVDDSTQPVQTVYLGSEWESKAYERIAEFWYFQLCAQDGSATAQTRQKAQSELLGILEWVWDTLAQPVLTKLGHTDTPTDDEAWPRVWWCPVGILSGFPIHAAGRLSEDAISNLTVMDRVISSYTATIRALAYARRDVTAPPMARSLNKRNSMLIVAVPDAPEAPVLPSVQREATLLSRLVSDATLMPTHGTQTTHMAVIAGLTNHSIVHFACHGIADPISPSKSRLLLHDHLTAPLTVADISRLRLADGQLAFLSACSTSDSSYRYGDEPLHITSAFQLAGYRNVIGTLWPVNDSAAMDVASDVYSILTANGQRGADPSHAAQALHHAIRRLRRRHQRTPTRWAAHVHVGG